jgi:Flp pilus assembly protein TadG
MLGNQSLREAGVRKLGMQVMGLLSNQRFSAACGRFRRDERGVAAVVFAIAFAALILVAGVAIDFGRTTVSVMRTQNALDSATLAASQELGKPDQEVTGANVANAYFQANTQRMQSPSHIATFSMDSQKGEVRATAKGSVIASLLKAAGFDTFNYSTKSTVAKGSSMLEVALVLDNSGSMQGTYIDALKTASRNLATTLYAGAEGTDKVKLAVVPFSSSVNVGPEMKDSGWIDKTGASSLHAPGLIFNTPVSRFDMFTKVGTAWRGCVEARPSPYDTNDTPPAGGDTLFVPMFAPDEPDPANSNGQSYSNNYLPDYGGTCPAPAATCLAYSRRGNCTQWSQPPVLTPATAQSRTCKYVAATQNLSSSLGPNFGCATSKILPLTATKDQVFTAIDAMQASGYTNIPEGLMWGWRALSPEPPFTEGRPYSTENNQKVIILMTDGENNIVSQGNHNKSIYSAYGFGAQDRIGTTYTTAGYRNALNQKLITACTNAKAKQIKIYTIAFRLESDQATRAMLAQCATSSSEAYTASDNGALIQAFEGIARNVSKLRVAG